MYLSPSHCLLALFWRSLIHGHQVYFTDVMPKTATGKIQRRIVAETMQKRDNKAKL